MALPHGTTGSLCPTFVSARLVSLAVRQAYAITLNERFPTALSLPSNASVTLWEATAQSNCPPCTVLAPDNGTQLDAHNHQAGISHCDSTRTGARASQSTSYSTQAVTSTSAKLQ